MNNKLVKLAIIRKNDSDPCPYGLEIPTACQQVGTIIEMMTPLQSSPGSEGIKLSNQHLFLWKSSGDRCRYADKILKEKTEAVECNWGGVTAGGGAPVESSIGDSKQDGIMGGTAFPFGSFEDNSVDLSGYSPSYSIASAINNNIINVTQAIHHILKSDIWKNLTPQEINKGYCEDFQQDVLKHLGGYVSDVGYHDGLDERVTENYPEMDNMPGHCWIIHKGKHYDAECPEGTNDVKQLPIFQRSVLNRDNM